LVLGMVARPAVLEVSTQERLPVLPVLLDESTSMDFPAARGQALLADAPPAQRSRLDAAQRAAQILQGPLSRSHRVRLYLCSDALRHHRDVPLRESDEAPIVEADELFDGLQATGLYSNLGDAVGDVLHQNEGERVSGVVLLSDGRRTGGEDFAAVARQAEAAEVPVHAVTFGSEHPLRDLRIDEVIVPPDASLGDVLAFHIVVDNQIREQLEIEVTLSEQDGPGASKRVRLPRGQSTVSLFTIPQTEGERSFTVSLPVQDDEVNEANNEQSVSVRVVKRGIRVLLVAGQPNQEYHFLVPALLRDPVVELSCYLQSANIDYVQQGNRSIERLPKTLKEWASYDVVVLYDPDPTKLRAQDETGIEHLVSKGGGLMMIAGRNFGLAKLLQVHSGKMRALLPVEIDKNLVLAHHQFFDESFVAERSSVGRVHPIMQIDSRQDVNERIWETFPPLYWSHPVEGLKPGAVSLLERAGDGEVGERCLMAVQRYGEGAVFYTGLNSFWLWRHPFGSYDYNGFWTRAIRYLGETRLRGSQQQVSLSSDKKVYAPGEAVQFTLRLLDVALMRQLEGRSIYAAVREADGGEQMVALRAEAGDPVYRGSYRALSPGDLTARVSQPAPEGDSEGKPLFEVAHRFRVEMRSLEQLDTSADLDGMRALAEKTGGAYYDYRNSGQLAELIDQIPTEKQVLERERIVEIWDSSWALLLFLMVAAAEWSLRKYWGVL